MPVKLKRRSAPEDRRKVPVSHGKVEKSAASRSSKSVKSATLPDDNVIMRKLAHNDRPVREEGLKIVTKYLTSSRTLDSFQLQKLWQGLWFTVWHSDRPLTQQALARELAALVESVKEKNLWTFLDSFWAVMIREWETLDRHRINKFYMLVRFYMRAIFDRLAVTGWNEKDLAQLRRSMLESGPLDPTSKKHPHSLRLHVIDVYLDELEHVFEAHGTPSPETADLILAPVFVLYEISDFKLIKNHVAEFLADSRAKQWSALLKSAASDEISEPSDLEDDFEQLT